MAAGRTFQHGSSRFTRNDFMGFETSFVLSLEGRVRSVREELVVVVVVVGGTGGSD